MGYTHTKEYYSIIKKMKSFEFAGKWIEMGKNTVGERFQAYMLYLVFHNESPEFVSLA